MLSIAKYAKAKTSNQKVTNRAILIDLIILIKDGCLRYKMCLQRGYSQQE